MEKSMLDYGILGIVVVALATYIIRIENRHRRERKELAERDERHFNRVNQLTDESNKVTRENTNILQGLKTLLENRKP